MHPKRVSDNLPAVQEIGPETPGKAATEALATQANPYEPKPGERPLQYPPEVIDRALLQCAITGGNARKAARDLHAMGVHIPHERISAWKRGRFANRYSELCSQEAAQLRERIAAGALELTAALQEGEGRALDRVLADLPEANAVEASIILKNLATTKQIALTQEAALRGRAGMIVEVRGIESLTDKLVQLGVAEVVESDAEEMDDVEVVAQGTS